MAQSKCPKCDAAKFEIKTIKPGSSKFDIALVQCAECGSVVGALESKNVSTRLEEIANQLLAILNQINLKLVAIQVR
jgi:uncharacterized Zn finger protein